MKPALNLSASTQFVAFTRSLLAIAIARAFSPPPDVPIWAWADGKAPGHPGVWLQSEDAAESGPYRSEKTVWTRRIQELPRRPFMWCWSYDEKRWVRAQITQVNIQKSTQSGFTEAILNVIRWMAHFLTRNVLYAIDTIEEAKKIARRLLRSLKSMHTKSSSGGAAANRPTGSVFTGDPDDIKSTEFILRGMELIFVGSFARGKFANKQAWLTVNDEIEEHDVAVGETSTTRDSFYRGKTHDDGLQFNLGKPKLEGGPINVLFKRGNREEFHIDCPHCGHAQPLTHRSEEYDSPFADQLDYVDRETGEIIGIVGKGKPPKKLHVILPRPLKLGETRKVKTGRFVYDHCRDLMGNWDELKILTEIFFECARCKGKIEEHQKHQLCLEAGDRDPEMLGWLPTAIGAPGIVSQHMSDLLSTDRKSSWGIIIQDLINAKKEGPKELQGVINNRFGNAWAEQLNKTEVSDIRENVAGKTLWMVDYPTDLGFKRDVFIDESQAKVVVAAVTAAGNIPVLAPSYCKPYKRGHIPFIPTNFLLGSDVGGNYARWVVIAPAPNQVDCAVIDWGDELDPDGIGEIVLNQTWPCLVDGKRRRIGMGFIDVHFRTTDVLKSCWYVFQQSKAHRLIPTAHIGGIAARSTRAWNWQQIQGYRGKQFNHKSFKQLGYNFRDSMNDVFINCIQRKNRRIWFPIELGKEDRQLTPDERQFILELTSDELLEDRNGKKHWADPPPGPNHYGAALRNAITGLRFLTRKHHLQRSESVEAAVSAAEEPIAQSKAEALLARARRS